MDDTKKEKIVNEEMIALLNAYKTLKDNGVLYGNIKFPQAIIKYFLSFEHNKRYDQMLEEFKKRYIYSESEIEKSHQCYERDGLGYVYDYISQKDTTKYLNLYNEIITIHQILYSKAPHPEAGGEIRNMQYYLPQTLIELSPPELIVQDICLLFEEFEEIQYCGDNLNSENVDMYIDYIKKCIRFKCKLIRIHPFSDGNGRTMRAFLNMLLKKVNIPPVYITPRENIEYRKNMEKALKFGEFEDIEYFYLYKICDSISELNYGIVSENLDISGTNDLEKLK